MYPGRVESCCVHVHGTSCALLITLQEHLNFTLVFCVCVVRVDQSSVFGDHCLSFFVLYFGHCIVCHGQNVYLEVSKETINPSLGMTRFDYDLLPMTLCVPSNICITTVNQLRCDCRS